MEIKQIKEKYQKALELLGDPGSQCDYLMELGFGKPPQEAVKKDCFRIAGCKAAIWLKMREEDGTVYFQSESDSILIRGILRIFEEMYQGRSRQEIKACPPDFLNQVSGDVLYPEIKENGIARFYGKLAGTEGRIS